MQVQYRKGNVAMLRTRLLLACLLLPLACLPMRALALSISKRPKMEELIMGAPILLSIAEGRLHWMTYSDSGPPFVTSEVPPPARGAYHRGAVFLEARVLRVLRCRGVCEPAGTVLIKLGAIRRAEDAAAFLGHGTILIVADRAAFSDVILPRHIRTIWLTELDRS